MDGMMEKGGTEPADLSERPREAGGDKSAGGPPPQRFSAKRKLRAVSRLLRGEPLELLARDPDVTAARLSQWRDRIGPPAGVGVLAAPQPIDLRKGADSLPASVQTVLRHDPFSGTISVFRCKRADRVKLLVWDGSGLVLLWKRLESGAFRWPPVTDGVMRLSAAQLAGLLDGLDWTRMHVPRLGRPKTAQ